MRNFMTHTVGLSIAGVAAYLTIHQNSNWGWFFCFSIFIEIAALLMDFAILNPNFRRDDD